MAQLLSRPASKRKVVGSHPNVDKNLSSWGLKYDFQGYINVNWYPIVCATVVLHHFCCLFNICVSGSNDWGHIGFFSLQLSCCQLYLRYNLCTERDINFIFDIHTPLIMLVEMTIKSMTLWTCLWHTCWMYLFRIWCRRRRVSQTHLVKVM